MRIAFNRTEIAGSLGDLGTLLPIAIGMILVNGLGPEAVFLPVGLMYLVAGGYFRVPVAVQPMKVVGAYALATAASGAQISAAAALLAVVLVFLGVTGLVNVLSRVVARPVVRGVQLSTGVLLMAKGVGFIVGSSSLQAERGLAEPFLAVQSLGPVPLGVVLGLGFGLLTMLLLDNKRLPAGIVAVGGGFVAGLALGGWHGLDTLAPGFHLPRWMPYDFLTGETLSYAALAFVLPQIPMTLGNAVIANRDLSLEYFGEASRRVTDRALCVSMGLGNALVAALGGMPLCHGAGGLAAHYRFGARTAGSNVIIGVAFVVLALVLGPGILGVVQALPLSVLGVLLVFAGAQLGLTVLDLRLRTELFVALLMLGIALATNLAWAFGVGILVSWMLRSDKLTI